MFALGEYGDRDLDADGDLGDSDDADIKPIIGHQGFDEDYKDYFKVPTARPRCKRS